MSVEARGEFSLLATDALHISLIWPQTNARLKAAQLKHVLSSGLCVFSVHRSSNCKMEINPNDLHTTSKTLAVPRYTHTTVNV